MSRIEHTLDIEVPVRQAYDQWTQFETFPEFMEGVESVTQLDDTHLHWVASIAGRRQEWDAEITEQTPDRRIAWSSTTGDRNSGSVDFHRVSQSRTRVTLSMEIEPAGALEKVGDALGVPSGQVRDDLERFRAFIEALGTATGGWRGVVEPDRETGPAGDAEAREYAGVGARTGAGSASELGATSEATGSTTAGHATANDPYGIGADASAYDDWPTGGAGNADDTNRDR